MSGRLIDLWWTGPFSFEIALDVGRMHCPMEDSYKRQAALFSEALELPPGKRVPYLAEACGGNAELFSRIKALLAASERASNILDSPAAPEISLRLEPSMSLCEKPGDRIGRYKLLQQIGEGGCGLVYMADQEEPVFRRVALKIIKVGMDTKPVIARFEAERQALALMEHPNIAKVFDAGATATGRPYFVMELVRGMKITDYCDEKKLSTRDRLTLFVQVCQALQHAHQKGIIHRDIKPSNILVTVNDGVAVPKVIDFGIAKATTGQRLTDKTVFTAFEQFIGTPAYMSPEQATLTSLDIDTRSDIYGLGVLLYEMLTGKTPFDAHELLATGIDEMRRTIREQEPPRPSTRVSALPDAVQTTTAHLRGLEAPKLITELRGDLDWIIIKALEKDRTRRYESASSFAADIERHLNNEPVLARPPSTFYRLQKVARRNKLAFAAVTAVAVALLGGAIVSGWQAKRARQERDSAKEVVKFFQENILAVARPEGLQGGLGKDISLRKAIDLAEPQLKSAFATRPLVEADIRSSLGESYWQLGEPALSARQLERAVELRRKELGSEHQDTVNAMGNLGRAYAESGEFEKATKLIEETFQLRRKSLGAEHLETIRSMDLLAMAYIRARKPALAIDLAEQAATASKAKLGPENPVTLSVLNNLGVAYLHNNQWNKATPVLEDLLARRIATAGPEHLETAETMYDLAQAYHQAGRISSAVPLYEKALAIAKMKFGGAHVNTLRVMYWLGLAYKPMGRQTEAREFLRHVLDQRTIVLGANHPDTLAAAAALRAMNEPGNPETAAKRDGK